MKRLAMALALALLAFSLGCGDGGETGPSTADFEKERNRLTEKRKAGGPQGGVQKVGKKAKEVQGKSELETYASVADTYIYDPKGKRDPFRSFRFENRSQLEQAEQRGPLEQFELGQLSIVAVVWDTGKPRALVNDPGGQSYVIREGSRVGKNDGRVIHIGDNLVLVKETYVDFAGERTTKDVELRIHRSQGG